MPSARFRPALRTEALRHVTWRRRRTVAEILACRPFHGTRLASGWTSAMLARTVRFLTGEVQLRRLLKSSRQFLGACCEVHLATSFSIGPAVATERVGRVVC